MKLKNKIISYFLIVSLAIAVPLVIFYTTVYNKSLKKESFLNANAINQRSALMISSYFQQFLEKARTISNMFSKLNTLPESIHKGIITELEHDILKKNTDVAAFWYNRQLKIIDSSWTKENGRYEIKYYRSGEELLLKEAYADTKNEGEEYKSIRLKNTEVIYAPYIGSYTGKKEDENMYINIAVPLLKNKGFAGLIGIDFTLDKIANYLKNIARVEESFSILIHSKGNLIYHPEMNFRTKQYMEYFKNCNMDSGFQTAFFSGRDFEADFYDENGKKYYCSFIPIRPADSDDYLYFGTFIPYNHITEKSRTILIYTLLLTLLGVSAIYLIVNILASKIVNPINDSVDFAAVIKEGDLTKTLQIKSKDEIGKLGLALTAMAKNLTWMINQIKYRTQDMLEIGSEEEKKSGKLRDASLVMATSSEEVFSSLTLMNENIMTVITNIGNINNKSTTIGSNLKYSKDLVNQTGISMGHINEKIRIINSIAKQTNLLALNASVEAARAGDAGKGFAVVAHEVRTLSQMTKEAATDIEEAIDKGKNIADQSERTVSELVNQLQEIIKEVHEITMVGEDIKMSIKHIEIAVNSLNTLSQENTSIADMLSANSEKLMENADNLNKMVHQFKTN